MGIIALIQNTSLPGSSVMTCTYFILRLVPIVYVMLYVLTRVFKKDSFNPFYHSKKGNTSLVFPCSPPLMRAKRKGQRQQHQNN